MFAGLLVRGGELRLVVDRRRGSWAAHDLRSSHCRVPRSSEVHRQRSEHPMPAYRFPGLARGDRWCVTAGNWLRAHQEGRAAPVVLASTHERTLRSLRLKCSNSTLSTCPTISPICSGTAARSGFCAVRGPTTTFAPWLSVVFMAVFARRGRWGSASRTIGGTRVTSPSMVLSGRTGSRAARLPVASVNTLLSGCVISTGARSGNHRGFGNAPSTTFGPSANSLQTGCPTKRSLAG